ncbi:MAG TPA: DUF2283 domain-containing protein [Thermomicrobiales bacterium]|jgi:uncharacterized protein YuzE
MEIRYDAEVKALYIRLAVGEVDHTTEVEEFVYLDVDQEGRPLGLEFVDAEDFFPFLERHGGKICVPTHVSADAPLVLAN